MKPNRKLVAGGTALALALAMGVAGVGSSTAYFSDTVVGGSIIVSVGQVPGTPIVAVDTGLTADSLSETATPDLDLGKANPNSTVSGSITVQNTGNVAQDIHIQFPNTAELQEFNNKLQQGASLEISVEGNPTLVFDASHPLPQNITLATGLGAGETIDATFTYHAGKSSAQDDQSKANKVITLHYSIVATAGGSSDTNTGGAITIEVKA